MREGFVPLDVAVVCRDATLCQRMLDLLGDPFKVQFLDDLPSFELRLTDFHCGIVALGARENSVVNTLRAYRRGRSVPILRIVDSYQDAWLQGRVVRNIDIELRSAVRSEAVRLAAAEMLDGASIPKEAKAVLQATAYPEPVPRSLKAAIARLRLNRQTVWQHYRGTSVERPGLPLKYVQEAIAVARSAAGKTRENRWIDVAMSHSFSSDWFREALLRQTGFHPRDLDEVNLEYLQLSWLAKYLRSFVHGDLTLPFL